MERVADEEAAEQGWFWNEQVGSYRPAGAMYCREGKVLIKDFDHVCPWTGTAIGHGNMLPFKLLSIYSSLKKRTTISLVQMQLRPQPMPKNQQHILQLVHDERTETRDPNYAVLVLYRAPLKLMSAGKMMQN
eukprot:scaffold6916_cov143-Skeletonema_menzelii.AAC.14